MIDHGDCVGSRIRHPETLVLVFETVGTGNMRPQILLYSVPQVSIRQKGCKPEFLKNPPLSPPAIHLLGVDNVMRTCFENSAPEYTDIN